MEEDSKLEANPMLGIFLVNVLIETFLKHTVPSQPVNLFLLVTFTNKTKLPVSYLEVLCLEQALSFLPHSSNLVFKIISRCAFASLSCGGKEKEGMPWECLSSFFQVTLPDRLVNTSDPLLHTG